MSKSEFLLEVSGLTKRFEPRGGLFARRKAVPITAVDGISFAIRRGETLALVGESGCGKSTTARLLMRLIEPSAGKVIFDGISMRELDPERLRQVRRRIQLVFQDPGSAFNPRMTVETIIAEPMRLAGLPRAQRQARVRELLPLVGLDQDHAARYPHEF